MSSVMDKALAMTERMVKARDEARAERDTARADLAEALVALRELYEAHDIGESDLEPGEREHIIDGAAEFARAILSKHAKTEGGTTP